MHLSAERFRVSAGYEAVHLPFKGGAEALTEVIAGRVDYYFCPIATAMPHIKAGRLLGLAVSSPKRAVVAARRADHARSRLSGFRLHVLDRHLRAGQDRRRRSCAKFGDEMQMALDGARGQEKLATLGVEAMPLTAAQFDALVKQEIVTYAEFAQGGLKGELMRMSFRARERRSRPGMMALRIARARSWCRSRRTPWPADC